MNKSEYDLPPPIAPWTTNGTNPAGPQPRATPLLMATPLLPEYGAVATTVVIDDPVDETLVPLRGVSGDAEDLSPRFRDVWFAVLFWMQMAIVVWLGIYRAPMAYKNMHFDLSGIEDELRKATTDISEKDIQEMNDFASRVSEYVKVYPARILKYLVLPCCGLAYFIAFFITAFIVKRCARPAVYLCLLGSILFTGALMLFSLVTAHSVVSMAMTGIILLSMIYYVATAWNMVPFAAVNLKVALEGMSRNCGIYIVAFIFSELAFAWFIFWLYTLVGVSVSSNTECKAAHPHSNFNPLSDDYDEVCDPSNAFMLFFLVSLYWTSTVVMNTIQVTVAGVMATWCFDQNEANNCCSMAVFNSLYRSLTFSFGSICFGSLLQAIVSVIRNMIQAARKKQEQDECGCCASILCCLLDCLVRWLEDLLEYFNQWAYVFVGIYGFSYLDSGRRVVELFRARGWTSILTDTLVGYVLGVVTFTTGILTGLAALSIEYHVTSNMHDTMSMGKSHSSSYTHSYLGLPRVGTFAIGWIIGVWVCTVMMSVIKGAVNTLIVCWADSPAVFEAEHPILSGEMIQAWSSVFTHTNIPLGRSSYPVHNGVHA